MPLPRAWCFVETPTRLLPSGLLFIARFVRGRFEPQALRSGPHVSALPDGAGTPAVFLDGRPVIPVSAEILEALIRHELGRGKGGSAG